MLDTSSGFTCWPVADCSCCCTSAPSTCCVNSFCNASTFCKYSVYEILFCSRSERISFTRSLKACFWLSFSISRSASDFSTTRAEASAFCVISAGVIVVLVSVLTSLACCSMFWFVSLILSFSLKSVSPKLVSVSPTFKSWLVSVFRLVLVSVLRLVPIPEFCALIFLLLRLEPIALVPSDTPWNIPPPNAPSPPACATCFANSLKASPSNSPSSVIILPPSPKNSKACCTASSVPS